MSCGAVQQLGVARDFADTSREGLLVEELVVKLRIDAPEGRGACSDSGLTNTPKENGVGVGRRRRRPRCNTSGIRVVPREEGLVTPLCLVDEAELCWRGIWHCAELLKKANISSTIYDSNGDVQNRWTYHYLNVVFVAHNAGLEAVRVLVVAWISGADNKLANVCRSSVLDPVPCEGPARTLPQVVCSNSLQLYAGIDRAAHLRNSGVERGRHDDCGTCRTESILVLAQQF